MPFKYINKLQDQRVLILGGTSGLGYAVAEAALEFGAIVLIASSKQVSVDGAIQRLISSYPDLKSKISGHVIDLLASNTENNIISLLKTATNDGIDLLDHVIITPGQLPPIITPDKFEPSHLERDQHLRLIVPLYFAKHAPGTYLKNTSRSSLTVTAGSARPKRGWMIPTIVRGSMEGMVRALALDLQPIRINMVLPGATETEFFTSKMSAEQMEGFKKTFEHEALTGKMGRPEHVSEAYLHILKDENMTGQVLISDGGVTLAPGMST